MYIVGAVKRVKNNHYAGLIADGDIDDILKNNYGINKFDYVAHPVDGEDRTIFAVITSLNDHYKWSRQRIARWLKTIGK